MSVMVNIKNKLSSWMEKADIIHNKNPNYMSTNKCYKTHIINK